ncbi:MAG: hypothetical protein MJ252_21555, partial [archaeon]|nr:hypothetical protein [archaeon]
MLKFLPKSLRNFKLILVSTYFHIIVNLVYIVSFAIISIHFLSPRDSLANYKIIQMLSKSFNEKEFLSTVNSADTFIDYIKKIRTQFYDNNYKAYVPLGRIRIKKYSLKADDCSNVINNLKPDSFSDSTEVINFYNKIYDKSYCGYPSRSSSLAKSTDIGVKAT